MMIGEPTLATLDTREANERRRRPARAFRPGALGAMPASRSTWPISMSRPARSSALPAFPATARRNSSRCWRASGRSDRRPDLRRGRDATSPSAATTAREHQVHGLPEEPLNNACVPKNDGGREHGVPHLRLSRRWPRRPLDIARPASRAMPTAVASYQVKTASPEARSNRFGRQCAARRAGPRADRRSRPADRRQPLLRPRLRRRSPKSAPDHEAAQSRRRGVAGQRRPRRTPRTLRPHPRDVGRPSPTSRPSPDTDRTPSAQYMAGTLMAADRGASLSLRSRPASARRCRHRHAARFHRERAASATASATTSRGSRRSCPPPHG